MSRWLAILLLSITFRLCHGAELHGRVVAVADGDTITVLDGKNVRHRVRLAGIDAPEKGQSYATRSRENLARWVVGQSVVIEWNRREQYGRLFGVVIAQGHDVNLEQVRAGMAWWLRPFADEQTSEDRTLYEAAEDEARRAKRGLWGDREPVPPWEWRAMQRERN